MWPPHIHCTQELLVMEGNDSSGGEDGRGGALKKLASKLNSFLTDARTIKTGQYLISLAHLCHLDTELAHHVWIDLFPRVWTALSDAQREVGQRYKCIVLLLASVLCYVSCTCTSCMLADLVRVVLFIVNVLQTVFLDDYTHNACYVGGWILPFLWL